MGLRINQNIAAMNAYRNLSVNDSSMSKSLEKLSSGFRINRAADDAAGLSISEGLRAQTGGLKVAVRNAQDGISVVQTAEGALTETHSLLQRMRDLAVQAANTGGNDTDARTAIKTEVDQITNEINRIGNATKYGANNLLDGSSPAGFDFQIGSQSGLTNKLNIGINDMRAGALGLQGAGATLQRRERRRHGHDGPGHHRLRRRHARRRQHHEVGGGVVHLHGGHHHGGRAGAVPGRHAEGVRHRVRPRGGAGERQPGHRHDRLLGQARDRSTRPRASHSRPEVRPAA